MSTNGSLILTSLLLFSIVVVMLLMAYDDGIPFGLVRKFNCRRGKHKHAVKFGRYKRALYYCAFCKEPRKHPELKLIEGGNKLGDTEFKI